ncbi:response regulator [uncultured Thiodictyon sp.]|uniref:response regulator transcription factor n=1 Tax=uncultured Thiodictyon sp. TaxID=1846217 RepID=UPI0025CBA535|nr:response regulator [uncultured Thiodictyon sp.]
MKPLLLLRHLTALYVEDDLVQGTLVHELLLSLFNEVLVAQSGEAGLRLFGQRSIQLLVTALRMQGMGGLALAAAIRGRDRTLPILITSASTETADLLAANRLQLVDYLVKPLALELLKAALERAALGLLAEGRVFVRLDADTTYCAADGTLCRLAQRVALTARERTLLDLLAAHRGQWLSTERLLAGLYTESDSGSEASLKNLLLRLRHKIGADAILNRYGIGYRLA